MAVPLHFAMTDAASAIPSHSMSALNSRLRRRVQGFRKQKRETLVLDHGNGGNGKKNVETVCRFKRPTKSSVHFVHHFMIVLWMRVYMFENPSAPM